MSQEARDRLLTEPNRTILQAIEIIKNLPSRIVAPETSHTLRIPEGALICNEPRQADPLGTAGQRLEWWANHYHCTVTRHLPLREYHVMYTIIHGRPALFLDWDGVMNHGHPEYGTDRDKLYLLRRIVDETRCLLIITSDRRRKADGMARMLAALETVGLISDGVTPFDYPNSHELERWNEIEDWRADNKHTGKFVILDDLDAMGALQSALVLTQTSEGLTLTQTDEVIKKLS